MKERGTKKGMVLATTLVLMLVIVALSVLIIVLASSSISSARLATNEADRTIMLNVIGNEFIRQVYNAPVSDGTLIDENMNAFIDGDKYSCKVEKVGNNLFILDVTDIIEKKNCLSVVTEVKQIDEENYSVLIKNWSREVKESVPVDINEGLIALNEKFISLADERKSDSNNDIENIKDILIGFTQRYLNNDYTTVDIENGYNVFDKNSSQFLYNIQIVSIVNEINPFRFMLVVTDDAESHGNIILKTTVTRELKDGSYTLVVTRDVPVAESEP